MESNESQHPGGEAPPRGTEDPEAGGPRQARQGAGRRDPLEELGQRVDDAVEELRPKLKRVLEELDTRVDAALRELKPRMDAAMREVEPRVDRFIADVQPRMDSVLDRIQSRIDQLRQDLEGRARRSAGDPEAGEDPAGLLSDQEAAAGRGASGSTPESEGTGGG